MLVLFSFAPFFWHTRLWDCCFYHINRTGESPMLTPNVIIGRLRCINYAQYCTVLPVFSMYSETSKVLHWGEEGWRCLRRCGSNSSSKAVAAVTVDDDKAVWRCHRQPCNYAALQRSGVLNILSVDTTDTTKDRVPSAELLQPGTWNIPPYFSLAVRSSNKAGQNGGTVQELRVDEVSSTDVIRLINLI